MTSLLLGFKVELLVKGEKKLKREIMMNKLQQKRANSLIKIGVLGMMISLLSSGAMAQRGSMAESGKPFAHAG